MHWLKSRSRVSSVVALQGCRVTEYQGKKTTSTPRTTMTLEPGRRYSQLASAPGGCLHFHASFFFKIYAVFFFLFQSRVAQLGDEGSIPTTAAKLNTPVVTSVPGFQGSRCTY